MADITKKLTLKIEGTNTSAVDAVKGVNTALEGTSAKVTSVKTEIDALTNAISHVATIAAKSQSELQKVFSAAQGNSALNSGIAGGTSGIISQDLIKEAAAQTEALRKLYQSDYNSVKQFAELSVQAKRAQLNSIEQLELQASSKIIEIKAQEAAKLKALEDKIIADRLAGKNTSYAKGAISAIVASAENSIANAKAPVLNAKAEEAIKKDSLKLQLELQKAAQQQEIALFKQTLATKEALLKASIDKQTAIDQYGQNSIQAQRAAANQKVVQAEIAKQQELASIQQRVANGQISATQGIQQAATAQDKYATAVRTANSAIKEQAAETQNLIIRVIEFIGLYRIFNTVFNAITNSIKAIPKIGIELEATRASLEATVGTASGVVSVMNALRNESERTGINIEVLRKNFSLLYASTSQSGESLETTWRIFTNLNTVITGLHLSADNANLTFLAIGQIFNKTKVQSEELVKQLGNLLPGAFAAFVAANKKANESQAEAALRIVKQMRDGTVLAHDTIENFSTFIAKRYAPAFNAAAEGINANIGRMQNAWIHLGEVVYEGNRGFINESVKGLTELGNSLAVFSEKAIEAKESFTDFLGITDRFESAIEGVHRLIAEEEALRNAVQTSVTQDPIQIEVDKAPEIVHARKVTEKLTRDWEERRRKFIAIQNPTGQDLYAYIDAEKRYRKELQASNEILKARTEQQRELVAKRLQEEQSQAAANKLAFEGLTSGKGNAAAEKAAKRAELVELKEFLRTKHTLVDTYIKELDAKAATEIRIEKNKLDELKYLRDADKTSLKEYYLQSEAVIKESTAKRIKLISEEITALQKDIGKLTQEDNTEGYIIKAKFDGKDAFVQVNQFDAIIQEMAAKYKVNPLLIKAVIQQESGGNPKAVSSAGAKGLMQLLEGTFKEQNIAGSIFDVSANIEAGTKYLSKAIEKFQGQEDGLILALAAYNAGPQRIANLLEKYKADWDKHIVSETVGYIENIGKNLDILEGTATNNIEGIESGGRKAEYTTTQILARQAQIKQLQEEQIQLEQQAQIELRSLDDDKLARLKKYSDAQETAMEKFIRQTKELNALREVQFSGKSLVPDKIFEGAQADILNEFAKSSNKEVEDNLPALKAYNDELKRIDESTTQLGATNSAVFDGALKDIHLVIGAFSNISVIEKKAATAVSDLARAFNRAAAESRRLKNAELSAVDIANDSPEDKIKKRYEIEKKYRDKDSKEYTDYLKAINKLDQESFEAKIAGYRQVSGALESSLEEGSAAQKAAHAVTTALAAVELATNIEKILGIQKVTAAIIQSVAPEVAASQTKSAANAVEGISAQGQIPILGFVLMAAMAALMASIGAFKGNLSSVSVDTSKLRQQTQGTGSVLGDSSAKSESIAKGIEILQQNSDIMVPLTQSMLRSLQNIETSISGVDAELSRSSFLKTAASIVDRQAANPQGGGGLFGGGSGKFDILDPLGLFGSSSSEIIDYGIAAVSTTLDTIFKEGFKGYNFTETLHKSTGFLGIGGSESVEPFFSPFEKKANDAVTAVLRSMADTVKDAVGYFGVSSNLLDEKMKSFVVNFGNVVNRIGYVSLKGLKGDEIKKELEAVFGRIGDDLAEFVFPNLKDFQKVGEGYFQTLLRVVSGIESANTQLEILGLKSVRYTQILQKRGDIETEIIRQAIINSESLNSGIAKMVSVFDGAGKDLVALYQELIAARRLLQNVSLNGNITSDLIIGAGGLDKLTSSLTSYFENFFSAAEQAAIGIRNLTADFRKLGLQAPITQAAYRAMVQAAARDTSAAGQKYLGKLLSLAAQTNEAINARQAVLDANIDNAMSALQRALDAQSASQSDAVDANRDMYNAQREAANTLLSALQNIKSQLDSALESTKVDNPQTSLAERNAAQALLLQASRSKESVTKIEGLDAALAILAKPSQNLYESFADYAVSQAKATGAIVAINARADKEISTAEATLKAIENAESHASDAAQAAANQRDDMLQSFQRQIDELRGIDTSVGSVESAIQALQKAINASAANKAAGEKQAATVTAKSKLTSAQSVLDARKAAKLKAAQALNAAKALKATTPAQIKAKEAQIAAATKAFQTATANVTASLKLVANLQAAYNAIVKANATAAKPAAQTAATPQVATPAASATTTAKATPAAGGTTVVVNTPAAKPQTTPLQISLASDKTFKELIAEVQALKKTTDTQSTLLNRIVANTGETFKILDKSTAGGGPMRVTVMNKSLVTSVANAASIPVKITSSVSHPVTVSGTVNASVNNVVDVLVTNPSTNRVYVRQIAG